MSGSKKRLFLVLAAGALLAVPLSGCGGGGSSDGPNTGESGGITEPGDDSGSDTPDAPGDGDGASPVDTSSLQALLGGADTLLATSSHCLAHADAGCGGTGSVTEPVGEDGDAGVPEPEGDGTVSTPNDGTADGMDFTDTVSPFECTGGVCTAPGGSATLTIADIGTTVLGSSNAALVTRGGVDVVEFAGSGGGGATGLRSVTTKFA